MMCGPCSAATASANRMKKVVTEVQELQEADKSVGHTHTGWHVGDMS